MKAPVPSSCFRSLCKQISRLHEALGDILASEELHVSWTFSKIVLKLIYSESFTRYNFGLYP